MSSMSPYEQGYDDGYYDGRRDGYNEGKEDEMRRQIIGYACELSSMLLRLGDDSLTQRIAKELAEDGGFTFKEEEEEDG